MRTQMGWQLLEFYWEVHTDRFNGFSFTEFEFFLPPGIYVHDLGGGVQETNLLFIKRKSLSERSEIWRSSRNLIASKYGVGIANSTITFENLGLLRITHHCHLDDVDFVCAYGRNQAVYFDVGPGDVMASLANTKGNLSSIKHLSKHDLFLDTNRENQRDSAGLVQKSNKIRSQLEIGTFQPLGRTSFAITDWFSSIERLLLYVMLVGELVLNKRSNNLGSGFGFRIEFETKRRWSSSGASGLSRVLTWFSLFLNTASLGCEYLSKSVLDTRVSEEQLVLDDIVLTICMGFEQEETR
ncbi:hypothetical protein Tco_0278514 [Tanacetum coccineum]